MDLESSNVEALTSKIRALDWNDYHTILHPEEVLDGTLLEFTLVGKFPKAEDRQFVLGHTPWNIRGNILVLLPWTPDLALSEMEFHLVAMWIQVHELPWNKLDESTAKAIGFKLGGDYYPAPSGWWLPHSAKQCKQIGSVKGTPSVGPLMRADPATIRRAIIICCLPSRLHDMGAFLHWPKSNAQDNDYSPSFMKCPQGSNFGTCSTINSSDSPFLLARSTSMLHQPRRQVEDDSHKGASVVGLAGSSSRKLTPREQVNVGGLPESPGGSKSVLGSRRNLLLEIPSVLVDELLPIQLSQHSPKSPGEKGTAPSPNIEPVLVFSSPPSSQLEIPTKKKVGLKALSHALSPMVSF
ncbi:hypothetical protein CJ030_MR1G016577 [Morella rubra]|uniref:Uncharacterized protein n=1 Tax=Morella rubra TaxID=262757 RepID=A0A6A1WMM0_9ROSI|nr:hypothetical protein CJ030_MR1G016577 [Morella rubra]